MDFRTIAVSLQKNIKIASKMHGTVLVSWHYVRNQISCRSRSCNEDI